MTDISTNEYNPSLINLVYVVGAIMLIGIITIVLLPNNDKPIVKPVDRSEVILSESDVRHQQVVDKLTGMVSTINNLAKTKNPSPDVLNTISRAQYYVGSIWAKELALYYDVDVQVDHRTNIIHVVPCIDMLDSDIAIMNTYDSIKITCSDH